MVSERKKELNITATCTQTASFCTGVKLPFASCASELRLECFCPVMKSRRQNTELPLNASEQDTSGFFAECGVFSLKNKVLKRKTETHLTQKIQDSLVFRSIKKNSRLALKANIKYCRISKSDLPF